ncbi:hypothetical protein [Methylobacterium sp. WL18]|nr:hypothetical protein [Methylobacterium sp. WL18]
MKVYFESRCARSAINHNLLNKHTAGTAVTPAIKVTNIILLLLFVKF